MILVLAMLMTMFAGLGTASAATTYSTTNVPAVSSGAGQNLGAVIIDFPVLNAGYHKAVVKLPADFVVTLAGAGNRVTNLSDAASSFAGVTDGAAITPDTPEAYDATVGAVFQPGQTVTVGGRTYTAAVAADLSNRVFAHGANATDSAAGLAAAITADTANTYTATNAAAVITLTQRVAVDGATLPVFTVAGTPGTGAIGVAAVSTPYAIGAASMALTALSGNQLQLEVKTPVVASKVKLAVILNNVFVPSGADAEINVAVMQLDGDFSDGFVAVGKTTGGALDIIHSDPGTLTAGTSAFLAINVRQDSTGAFTQATDSLKLKLPKGVTWSTTDIRLFPGVGQPSLIGAGAFSINTSDASVLKINKLSANDNNTYTILAMITIDEEEAAFGDILATASGRSTVNMSSVKLGTYADFGYTIKAEKPELELQAGLTEQEISKITVKESIAGSILTGRNVIMKLPDGVQWSADFPGTLKAGSLSVANFAVSANDRSRASGTITNNVANKGEMALENVEVNIAVDFTGDITVQFSGSAGINEEIVVGTVYAPVAAKADKESVKIGVQGQAAGNITITETHKEAIQSRIWDASLAPAAFVQTSIDVVAPYGVTWDKLPTVKVTEGDLSIGTPTRVTANNGKHVLRIPIKSQSREASKIEISNVVYTLDRTVPEGDLKLVVGGTALDQAGILNRTAAAVVVAATCVTPAPGDVLGNGQFRIDSNIYYVGGVAKVMDAAPYIKNDRTYVPMRFLGEILGAEVVWDDAARTVTLTKGDDVAVFTIGSTSYTVNGEAKTADVAPEIANSRTMLPARFVAEAFGAVVGWDAATQTVLIQN